VTCRMAGYCLTRPLRVDLTSPCRRCRRPWRCISGTLGPRVPSSSTSAGSRRRTCRRPPILTARTSS
jgi:hypothetical protein